MPVSRDSSSKVGNSNFVCCHFLCYCDCQFDISVVCAVLQSSAVLRHNTSEQTRFVSQLKAHRAVHRDVGNGSEIDFSKSGVAIFIRLLEACERAGKREVGNFGILPEGLEERTGVGGLRDCVAVPSEFAVECACGNRKVLGSDVVDEAYDLAGIVITTFNSGCKGFPVFYRLDFVYLDVVKIEGLARYALPFVVIA